MSEALDELRHQYVDKFGKKPFHGWDEAKLADLLAADDAEPEPKPDGVRVVLRRSHWIGEERHDPPEVLEVDIDTALRLIENGVAGRTDPLKVD